MPSLAPTSRRAACTLSHALKRSASTTRRPSKPPIAPAPPAAPRPRLKSLSNLDPAAHRLAFRSLPYASPPHLVAPSPSHLTYHAQPYFSLRCFPSVPRSDRTPLWGVTRPRPRAKTESVHPVDFLRGRTASSSSRVDSPFLSPSELRASLAAHSHSHRSNTQPKPYTLDLTLFASKKRVHKSAVVRERCKRRVREAVRLVVARGARGCAAAPTAAAAGEGLETREEDLRETGPRKWLVPGHHYILSLTLEVYRAPLPLLVDHLRTALRSIRRKAEAAILARQLADLELCPRATRRTDDDDDGAAPGRECTPPGA
ncbi:small nuclear ribonucleo protein polypeptide A [Rhodotorula diobovata]|uniref:Small nuclear ribonucleo protein polypeptide A n=1 Tax=Rhodotorula diobovata TaxID=5288 RepID=A0A5C5G4D8_9BASI|nr:small nuclear ribonucleo protein polypeptide A [Rhodotorula diobovata]